LFPTVAIRATLRAVSVITLTTDFGTRDWFVGTLKAVVLNFHPRATVVDITHGIAPGDIRGGAFALMASCRFFPKGTVHLAVVDPGVGTSRRAIAVQTADFFFVGPDNGVMSWALARERIKAIRALENEKYFLRPVSGTFHGRDIFAPVAAHLSRGVPIRGLGPAQEDFMRLPWPKSRLRHPGVEGEVLYLDRFGNAITNIEADAVRSLGEGALHVFVGRKRLCPIGAFYQSVPSGRPVAVLGSSGFLEIAVNGGSAAQQLGLRVGQAVTVRA
jgi:S-adenosyl-L-methionine hydrolase (adenosine-forming)